MHTHPSAKSVKISKKGRILQKGAGISDALNNICIINNLTDLQAHNLPKLQSEDEVL